ALKISHLEQLNNEIFALLSTRFNCLKIDYLIKRVGITKQKKPSKCWARGLRIDLGGLAFQFAGRRFNMRTNKPLELF
ncbi:MAG: hypothetical protein CMK65_15960, partial [Pseudoalteromonas sp.]|nr:hypothetical protein [Pseudoalteromonas sp.]